MKTLLFGFILMLTVGTAFAEMHHEFNMTECEVMVVCDQDCVLSDWFICITNGIEIGLHNINEGIVCEQTIEIPGFNEWFDVSEFVNCENAVPSDLVPFEAIKAMYR